MKKTLGLYPAPLKILEVRFFFLFLTSILVVIVKYEAGQTFVYYNFGIFHKRACKYMIFLCFGPNFPIG